MARYKPDREQRRKQFIKPQRHHDYNDYYHPDVRGVGGESRGMVLPSQTNNPAYGWWGRDHEPWRGTSWSFYSNGGGLRPAWEDVVLNLVDMRNWKERHDRDELQRRREADEIRSVGLINRRRATKEARALSARHRRRARQREVSSWHAPRTEAGYPEGYQPRETTEGDDS